MSTEIEATPEHLPTRKEHLGHPTTLWMILFVTVGLNYAFYGFRSFLAPYIAQAFYADLSTAEALQHANLLTAGMLALLYATHVIGGWVADNVVGEVRSLRTALWLETVALVLMTFPSRTVFVLALALFALGAGLSIPLTVLVGRNYGADDPRRDAGYTLFYLAINLGAFIAPFICADWVAHAFGYRFGFLAAGIGVGLSALLFQLRSSRLEHAGQPQPRFGGRYALALTLIGIAILVFPTMLLIEHPKFLRTAVDALLALLVLYFIISSVRRGNRVQTQRYIAMLLLFAGNVMFWALSLQGATSLNFFARDYVNAPFDFTLFQSANPLYILIFAPVLAVLWPWLDKREINPSTPRKFGIGIVLVGLSYGVMVYAAQHLVGAELRVPWWTLAICYLLQTIGELTLSPIGYAMVTRLAAPDEASLAMGGWFFSYAMAYAVSGQIAAMTTTGTNAGMAGYTHVYGLLFGGGLAIGFIYLVTAPWLTRLMHGVR